MRWEVLTVSGGPGCLQFGAVVGLQASGKENSEYGQHTLEGCQWLKILNPKLYHCRAFPKSRPGYWLDDYCGGAGWAFSQR